MPGDSILAITEPFEIGFPGRTPIVRAARFELPTPGVYTLEGPNGSGKSLFVHMLTGTLPGDVQQSFAPVVWLKNNRHQSIRNYRQATRAGISAVFQDDDLISSMTVFDYLVLAHSNTTPGKLGQYSWETLYGVTIHPVSMGLKWLGPALPDTVTGILDRIEPHAVDWRDRRALRAAATQLLQEHGLDPALLDQLPGRLSGGARAAARILSAQLFTRTKVLLLDEAFNSVERNVWPRFLETLKRWAYARGAAILAISHSNDELTAWEPNARFEINDGLISEAETFEHGITRRFGRRREDVSPVYEVTDASEQKVVFDSIWERLKPFEQIIWVARSRDAIRPYERYAHGDVGHKEVLLTTSDGLGTTIENLLERIHLAAGTDRTVVVVVGDSQLRAIVTFSALLAAHVDMGGLVVILSSFQDAADTILSSNVSMQWKRDHPPLQMRVGTRFFPAAYVVYLGDRSASDRDGVRTALVQCMRLGLLFDAELFRDSCEALRPSEVPLVVAKGLFNRAVHALNQLADVEAAVNTLRPLLEMGSEESELFRSKSDQESSIRLLGLVLNLIATHSDEVAQPLIDLFRSGGFSIPETLRLPASPNRLAGSALKAVRITQSGSYSVRNLRANLAPSAAKRNTDLATFMSSQVRGSTVRLSPIDIERARVRMLEKLQR